METRCLLAHIRDRVEATGGSVTVTRTQDLTIVEASFPGPHHEVAAAHSSRRRSGPKADLVT